MARIRRCAVPLALAAALFALEPVPAPAVQPKKGAVEPLATDPLTMKVAKGFKVELLYSVPKEVQGSWVSMCTDPKGRLIVSDQYGALYRVTPPKVGATGETKVEKLSAQIGSAQGLLWAFDALYVVVNAPGKGKNNTSGLYRVTASKKDDNLDTVELLRALEGGGGEHGPHAVLLNPDGKRLTVVCGNQTKLTRLNDSDVPQVWGEDHLLPRLPDGNGFMKGVLGPGGAIYNVSPDGKEWSLQSTGYRNEYDAAYHANGDLFTYDADMEWDFNTPWYRPTRVCWAAPGVDFGWRNGAGKYPVHYADTIPGVIDIGPGSPTGVCFGYGAKFPAKYQHAFYICDWSYGKLYAVHLEPEGASYKATAEEFVTGTPLPLTDLVVNPTDGALYFAIGGRRTKSGLYRVTYTGTESTAVAKPAARPDSELEKARQFFTREMGNKSDASAAAALKHLDSPDRTIRALARATLEHQGLTACDYATHPKLQTAGQEIARALAVARLSTPCQLHTPNAKPDAATRAAVLNALNALEWEKLSTAEKLELARTYQVALHRLGPPTDAERAALVGKLKPLFPTNNRFLDGMLLETLVYLQDATVAPKAVKLLKDAPTQEEQIEYARSLRMLKVGWSPALRKDYFAWFVKAANYKGGNSFAKFLKLIRDDAVQTLTDAEVALLGDLVKGDPAAVKLPPEPPRPFVKQYKMDDLVGKLDALKSGRDYDRGRKMFAAAKCFACHRFDGEGGSNAPDLTGAAGRFSARDLLESMVEPSKEISDQYAAVEIRTNDERVIVGRIVNLNTDNVMVNTDMFNPGATVSVDRKKIESLRASKISMMPTGLIDTLKEDEVLDLLAYMLSRGDRTNAMFKK